jgi:hypothetical protein
VTSATIATGVIAGRLGHQYRKWGILDTLQPHSHNDLPGIFADVAELADAQVSEACDGDIVEVQVLSSAPIEKNVASLKSRLALFVFSCI